MELSKKKCGRFVSCIISVVILLIILEHMVIANLVNLTSIFITKTLTTKTLSNNIPTAFADQGFQYNSLNQGIIIGGIPYSMAINPDTNIVYVADKFSKRISFIDGNTGEVIQKVNLTSDNTSPNSSSIRAEYFRKIGLTPSIAISNTTNLLYAAYTDSDLLWIMDGTTGDLVSRLDVGGIPRSISADPLSQYVYVSTLDYANPDNRTNVISEIAGTANTVNKQEPLNTTSNVSSISAITTETQPNKRKIMVYAAAGDFNERGEILSIESNIALNVTNFGKQERLWESKSFGAQLHDIDINLKDKKIYTISHSDNHAYVIKSEEKKEISKIKVGHNPDQIAIDRNKNKIYVSDASSNTVSVINGSNNSKILTIEQMDRNPRGIAVNPNTHMVYVANMLSGTVSFINGSTDKVNSVINFRVNPEIAGDIHCKEEKPSYDYSKVSNRYNLYSKEDPSYGYSKVSNRYSIYSNDAFLLCESRSNTGFVFSSWSGNLPLSEGGDLTKRFLKINTSKSGSVNANFVNATPIPPELWTPLYGIIPAILVSVFIPLLLQRNKNKRQSEKYRTYYTNKIGKLDKDELYEVVTQLYNEGKINELDYKSLKEKISKN
jgi:YVTN family beta-propeller protein